MGLLIRNERRRAKELYVITAEHAGYTSVVKVPEGHTADEAGAMLIGLSQRHRPLVEGTAIIDNGVPVYRLWKLWGSSQKEDMETV